MLRWSTEENGSFIEDEKNKMEKESLDKESSLRLLSQSLLPEISVYILLVSLGIGSRLDICIKRTQSSGNFWIRFLLATKPFINTKSRLSS